MPTPIPFPTKKYKVIYADPAWTFKTFSEKGKEKKSAENHYGCMTIDDIKALPVQDIADEDCTLLIWVTMPLLQEGLETIKAWGFEYKTCGFTWAKRNKKASGFFMGLGYWTRANAELCLLATKGKPQRKEDGKDVPQLITSRIREHSRKPEQMYGRIERLVEGPYIELFARDQREGWDCWGNDTEKFVEK